MSRLACSLCPWLGVRLKKEGEEKRSAKRKRNRTNPKLWPGLAGRREARYYTGIINEEQSVKVANRRCNSRGKPVPG